jgi:Xaa-Pro dipeptidase
LWDLTELIFQALRPGNTVGDIYSAYKRGLKACGLPEQPAVFGRIGHGIGLDQVEPPSITEGDDRKLVSGMTLCIEPNCLVPEIGLLIAEEQIVITETGYELLNKRASRDPLSV